MDKDNLTRATKHWDTARKSLCQYSLGRTLFRIMRLNRFKTLKITQGFYLAWGTGAGINFSLLMGNRLLSRRHSNCRFLPALQIGLIPPPPQEEWKSPQSQQWSAWLYPQVKCNQYTEMWAKPKHSFHSSLHYLNLMVSTVKYYEEYHRGIQSKSPHNEK